MMAISIPKQDEQEEKVEMTTDDNGILISSLSSKADEYVGEKDQGQHDILMRCKTYNSTRQLQSSND